MYLGLSSVLYDGVNDGFHHLGVVARMYAGLFQPRMRMVLHGDSFLRIVSSNVLEHLVLGQGHSVLGVTSEPESWRACIEIISNAKIVLPDLHDGGLRGLLLFFLWLGWFGKHVVVIQVVQVEGFILLLVLALSRAYYLS